MDNKAFLIVHYAQLYPTGVPHFVQNFEPSIKGAPQLPQNLGAEAVPVGGGGGGAVSPDGEGADGAGGGGGVCCAAAS